jgi:hypothetical protein
MGLRAKNTEKASKAYKVTQYRQRNLSALVDHKACGNNRGSKQNTFHRGYGYCQKGNRKGQANNVEMRLQDIRWERLLMK